MMKIKSGSGWFLARVGLGKLLETSEELVGSLNKYCIRTGYLSIKIEFVGKVQNRINY
jgi:hypothetical protein